VSKSENDSESEEEDIFAQNLKTLAGLALGLLAFSAICCGALNYTPLGKIFAPYKYCCETCGGKHIPARDLPANSAICKTSSNSERTCFSECFDN
jgi:hypothetical protein